MTIRSETCDRARRRWLSGLVCVLVSAGCVTMQTDYGRPVPDPGGISPGVTSRAEVLARLGPPEEFEQPTPFRGRSFDPQATRVFDERDLFDRRSYTWVAERRRDRYLILIPFLTLYGRFHTDHRSDRLMITFDENDRVRDVSLIREIDA